MAKHPAVTNPGAKACHKSVWIGNDSPPIKLHGSQRHNRVVLSTTQALRLADRSLNSLKPNVSPLPLHPLNLLGFEPKAQTLASPPRPLVFCSIGWGSRRDTMHRGIGANAEGNRTAFPENCLGIPHPLLNAQEVATGQLSPAGFLRGLNKDVGSLACGIRLQSPEIGLHRFLPWNRKGSGHGSVHVIGVAEIAPDGALLKVEQQLVKEESHSS
jgi:hypothetical protein